MGYHIFLAMVLRARAPSARAELRYKQWKLKTYLRGMGADPTLSLYAYFEMPWIRLILVFTLLFQFG